MCCYDPRFGLHRLTTVRLRSRLPLSLGCRLLLCCCYVVLRSSWLKLFCLQFLIDSMLTHNPARKGPCIKLDKVDCIWSSHWIVSTCNTTTRNHTLPVTLKCRSLLASLQTDQSTWLPKLNSCCTHNPDCPAIILAPTIHNKQKEKESTCPWKICLYKMKA